MFVFINKCATHEILLFALYFKNIHEEEESTMKKRD